MVELPEAQPPRTKPPSPVGASEVAKSKTMPPKRQAVGPAPVVGTRAKKPLYIEYWSITAWLVSWVVPSFIHVLNEPTKST